MEGKEHSLYLAQFKALSQFTPLPYHLPLPLHFAWSVAPISLCDVGVVAI